MHASDIGWADPSPFPSFPSRDHHHPSSDTHALTLQLIILHLCLVWCCSLCVEPVPVPRVVVCVEGHLSPVQVVEEVPVAPVRAAARQVALKLAHLVLTLVLVEVPDVFSVEV